MDYAEQLHILSAAQGDPAALALALVDLTFHADPPGERAALRDALEAAAVPHWITAALLASLLGITEEEAAPRLARLRRLTVVEPFPARGEGACNVHEQARLALRRRLAEQEPERFRALSARATETLASQTSAAARIEHACHLAVAEPARGARAIAVLRQEWDFGGRFEEAQALAAVCEELRGLPSLAPEVRAMVALTLPWLRKNHLSAEQRMPLLREAAEIYRELQDDWMLGLSLENLGDVLAAGGRREAARRAHEEALRVRRRLAPALDAVTLATAGALRNVSVSLNKLGDLDHEQGRPEAARLAYAEGLEVARRLAALDSANTLRQRDVSVSLDRLGDLDREQGRPEAARLAYAEGLEIRRRLAALDSANTGWQRDVSVSLNKLGDLDREQGQPDAAKLAYAEGLEIRRRLAALDSANTQWQRDVSVSLERLGDRDREQGHPDAAKLAYAEGLEIRRRLAALDSANTQWQRDVSVSLERLGDLDREQGRPDAARLAYAEGLEIDRRLAALDTANTQWQRDVSISLERLGDLDREQGRPEAARLAYTEGLQVARRLAAHDTAKAQWQRDVNYSLHMLGRLLLDEGRAQEASPLFAEALGISEKLSALDPQNVTWQKDVRVDRSWLAKAEAAAEEKGK